MKPHLGLFFSVFLTFTFVKAEQKNLCQNKTAGILYGKLQSRQTDVEDAIQSTIKLIHSLNQSEKIAKRTYDISSKVNYAIMAASGIVTVPALGVTAIGAGAASLSLRLSGTFIAGNTLRKNTVDIGNAIIVATGVAAGTAGWGTVSANKNYETDQSKFDSTLLTYAYKSVRRTQFDPYARTFTEARSKFSAITKKMAKEKNATGLFNWNGARELNRRRIEAINNFYLFQLLALEKQTIQRSLESLAIDCTSETVAIDIDVQSEINEIMTSYQRLKDFDLGDVYESSKEEKDVKQAR